MSKTILSTEALDSIRDDLHTSKDNLPDLTQPQQQHESDQANPHTTSKEGVGLGDLQNYPVATPEEAATGIADDLYLTPALSESTWGDHAVEQTINTLIRQPVAVSPIGGESDIGLTLVASKSAHNVKDGSPLKRREYEIDLVSGDFTSPVHTGTTNDDTGLVVPRTLDYSEGYKWRCRDITVNDDISDWSEPVSFTTKAYVPLPLAVTSPVDGGGIAIGDNITWTDYTSSDTESLLTFDNYVLQIATDEQFTNILKDEIVLSTTYEIGSDLPRETVLFIRIKPQWSTAHTTPWSAVSEMTIDAYELDPVSITAPASGSVVSVGIDPITYQNADVSDPENIYTFVEYEVQISDNPSFSNVNHVLHIADKTTTTFKIPEVANLTRKTVYARVRPVWLEGGAVSPWSPVVSLQTITMTSRYLLKLDQDGSTGKYSGIYDVNVDQATSEIYLLNGMWYSPEVIKKTPSGETIWTAEPANFSLNLHYVPRTKDNVSVIYGSYIYFIGSYGGYLNLVKMNKHTGAIVGTKQHTIRAGYTHREITSLKRIGSNFYILLKAARSSGYPSSYIIRTAYDFQSTDYNAMELVSGSQSHTYTSSMADVSGKILVAVSGGTNQAPPSIIIFDASLNSVYYRNRYGLSYSSSDSGFCWALERYSTTAMVFASMDIGSVGYIATVDLNGNVIHSYKVNNTTNTYNTAPNILAYNSDEGVLYGVSHNGYNADSITVVSYTPTTSGTLSVNWARKISFDDDQTELRGLSTGPMGVYITTTNGYLICLDHSGGIGAPPMHPGVTFSSSGVSLQSATLQKTKYAAATPRSTSMVSQVSDAGTFFQSQMVSDISETRSNF